MKIDKYFLKKAYIALIRALRIKQYYKIMSGPLKGFLWDINTDYRYILGIYESKTVDLLKKYTQKGKGFYDLGANSGYFSLVANQFGMKSYAFEPNPQNIELLTKHVKLNNKEKDITLFPYAVCDKSRILKFTNDSNLAANTYTDSKYTKTSSFIEVQGVSLDEFFKENDNIEKPYLLKIDVEGAELDVLNGAKETLLKYFPTILLSTHDIHIPNISSQCVDFLQNLGYTVELGGEMLNDGWKDYIVYGKQAY
jgi:FkbM family methyltransferase